jgi:hypothetical protein
MALDPVTLGIDLLSRALEVVGLYISKQPNWSQEKKDEYFSKVTRYNELKNMDRQYRDDNEFLNCQDDLAAFISAYGEELKK